MKRFALAFGLAVAGIQPGLAAPAPDAAIARLGQRLFPVLISLDTSAEPAAVRAMLAQRAQRQAACAAAAPCRIAAAAWTDAEAALVADLAGQTVSAANAKRASGAKPTPASNDEARAAVRREIAGLNGILRVYGTGAPTRYSQIDGPIAQPGSDRFATDITAAAALAELGSHDPVSALDASIALALALLDVNNRDEAVAFGSLDSGFNRAAFDRAAGLDWPRFRYSAILVLGVGPDDLATPLSPLAKLNVRNAAQRYFDGVAPFLIVSGGTVHPRGTHFAEAMEMRRALIERYHVPADAVIVDPYARHTTTNLRNASRLLMAMQVPLDRDVLIVTNPVHSRYVEGPEFAARNLAELGYQPGTIGKRVSPYEIAFRPSALSARIDPADPLDP